MPSWSQMIADSVLWRITDVRLPRTAGNYFAASIAAKGGAKQMLGLHRIAAVMRVRPRDDRRR